MNQTIKTVFTIALLVAGTSLLQAKDAHVSEKSIRHMDRTLTSHHAKKRDFRTKDEFRRKLHHLQKRGENKYRRRVIRLGKDLRRSPYDENYYRYESDRMHLYGRPYRYPKRGWILAYRYDRADFYDRDGFLYGYFNRYGYYFEGIFYRYDRFYTYQDRVRGRGMFDRYYYPPADYRYYGFCLRQ